MLLSSSAGKPYSSGFERYQGTSVTDTLSTIMLFNHNGYSLQLHHKLTMGGE